ncbi:unnamed protein product [Chrysoparadoxa australica]
MRTPGVLALVGLIASACARNLRGVAREVERALEDSYDRPPREMAPSHDGGGALITKPMGGAATFSYLEDGYGSELALKPIPGPGGVSGNWNNIAAAVDGRGDTATTLTLAQGDERGSSKYVDYDMGVKKRVKGMKILMESEDPGLQWKLQYWDNDSDLRWRDFFPFRRHGEGWESIDVNDKDTIVVRLRVKGKHPVSITHLELYGSKPFTIGCHAGSPISNPNNREAAMRSIAQKDFSFDQVLYYTPISGYKDYSSVKKRLDWGKDVVWVIEFMEDSGNKHTYDRVLDGEWDGRLQRIADGIIRDNRRIMLRPFHEFNGGWYNWGFLYGSSSPEKFVRAWRYTVDFFRQRTDLVRFQLNYNVANGRDDKTSFSRFWPGKDYVDSVVVSCFNRAYTSPWHQYWSSFEELYAPAYGKLIPIIEGTPLGVAETSSTSYRGDKAQWIRDTFQTFRYRYPEVTEVNFFLENKGNLDWDLNTDGQVRAFVQGGLEIQRLHA